MTGGHVEKDETQQGTPCVVGDHGKTRKNQNIFCYHFCPQGGLPEGGRGRKNSREREDIELHPVLAAKFSIIAAR